MVAKYSFNSQYRPLEAHSAHLPSLRLLEGGVFQPNEFSPVIIEEEGQIRLRFFRWGLETAWERVDQERKKKMIVPANHLFELPEYQLPIRSQRCLIPADGFYLKHQNRTYKLTHPQEGTFCFAGIYTPQLLEDGTWQHTFSLVSTPSRGKLKGFGLQMPMILPKQLEQRWLAHDTALPLLAKILDHPDVTPMSIHPVEELQGVPAFDYEVLRQVAA